LNRPPRLRFAQPPLLAKEGNNHSLSNRFRYQYHTLLLTTLNRSL
jgi:hypothetical protein